MIRQPGLQIGSILVLLSNGSGEFTVDFGENLSPGTIYAQWFYHAPGALGLPLQTSEGLEIEIGR